MQTLDVILLSMHSPHGVLCAVLELAEIVMFSNSDFV